MEKLIDHVITWSELVVAFGAALMAVVIGLKRVYKMARNIETLVEHATQGEAKLAAAISKLDDVDRRVVEIKKEVLPNGGSSMRDAVNRIEQRVGILETWHEAESRLAGRATKG